MQFDESVIPFHDSSTKESSYNYLDSDSELSPLFLNTLQAPLTQNLPVVSTETVESPTQIAPVVNEAPRHAMTTRSRDGTRKPKQVLSLHTQTCSPLPKSHLQALDDPFWNPSMHDEYDAMI